MHRIPSRARRALAISLLLSQSVFAQSLPAVDRSLPTGSAKRSMQPDARRLTLPMRVLPTAFDAKSIGAEAVARAHLEQMLSRQQRAKSASEQFELLAVSRLRSGADIVQFKRRINGIEVFREDVGMLLDAQSRLVAFRGTEARLEPAARALPAFTLSASDAFAAAIGAYGFTRAAIGKSQPVSRVDGDYEWFTPAAVLRSEHGAELREPVRTKAVYFRDATVGLVPAWYVETQVEPRPKAAAEYYAHVISAVDGRLLFRHFQQADGGGTFSYRVWAEAAPYGLPQPSPYGRNDIPHPTGLNNGLVPAYVAPSLVALPHSIFSQNDPWLQSPMTVTTGNNVDAYADIAPPNGFSAGDLRATTTSALTFDRSYNVNVTANASATQRMAAVTQQFYWVNWLHDFFYDHGFAEVDGNAQADNYGRGGLANDAILAEAQDFDDVNNANMATPADGGQPRMQMQIFNIAGPKSLQMNPAGGPTYSAGGATFGAAVFNFSDDMIRAAPVAACSAVTNGAQLAGKIAFVDRGGCGFDVKASNAQNAGAVGVVIGNVSGSNNPSVPPNMGPSDIPVPGITVPVLSVNFADAEAIRALLADMSADTAAMSVFGRDGTIDGSIVAHEWGHYLSNRLIGDAAGLSNAQGYGMGEGWADFTALLAMVKEQDRAAGSTPTFADTYAIASYAHGNSYSGSRRYPYSRDMAKNPLMFRHISNGTALPLSPAPAFGADGADNAEVHNTGEVWASALWDCYSGLLDATPVGAANFSATQNRMKDYLVGGYKLTPSAPTLLEARDAILAVIGTTSTADFNICADAFARRGMGILAVDAPRQSVDLVGAVQDTTIGGDLSATAIDTDDASCDNDGYLDLGETGAVDIDVQNSGWTTITNGTVLAAANHAGLNFTGSNPAALVSFVPYATQTVSVPVQLATLPASGIIQLTATPNGNIITPPGDAFSVYARVGANETAAASSTERFNAQAFGWTTQLGNGAPASFAWVRTPMDATGSRIAVGPDSSSAGTTSLISPPMSVGSGAFKITLTHRYQFDGGTEGNPNWDGALIEISDDNGANWTSIGGATYDGILYGESGNPLAGQAAFVGTSPGHPATTTDSINLGTTYAGDSVRIRLTVATDQLSGAPGWEVHTVEVSGTTSQPFTRVTSDRAPCGALVFSDGFDD